MTEKSLIIIGAGIAGLSTGSYARMNGYRTHIFEQHNRPGGVCTAWERQGYTIDGCIHWLVGSKPGSDMYRMYEEVGALQGNRLLIREHWGYYADEATGQSIDITADLDRLEADLHALAPEDGAIVDEIMAGTRRLRGFPMPMDKPRELMGRLDGIRSLVSMLPYMRYLRKIRQPMSEFLTPVKSPFLRWLLPSIVLPEMPAVTVMVLMGALADGTLSTVEGGSLRFAQAMETRYKDLGGELTYKASVEEILVEGDKAVGVRLADGSTHRADYVVSAADGYSTIFKMLGGRYVDDKVRERYETWPQFEPILFVDFGVADTFAGRPLEGAFRLAQPMTVGGREVGTLGYRLFANDPTLAPAGKTVVQSLVPADYDYWQALYQDRPRYEAEKARVAEQVLARLEPHLPGITAKVEMTDVASPVTLERYTRNHRGCFEGWLPTARLFGTAIERTLPGLDNFYMAGQWVELGGGIPPAVAHGSHIAQLLCRRDGKRYHASRP
jgi:phytoene desaturase